MVLGPRDHDSQNQLYLTSGPPTHSQNHARKHWESFSKNVIFEGLQQSLCITISSKRIFCTNNIANTFSFLQFQASHLGIENRSNNHDFPNPFLGPYFSHVFLFFRKDRFEDPLHNPAGAKMAPPIDQVTPKGYNFRVCFFPLCASLLNHINVPLGQRGF